MFQTQLYAGVNAAVLALYLSLLDSDEDKSAFAQLYEAYERKMYAVAISIVRSQALAEDVVHDSFLKIIRHFEKCRSMARNERESWIVILTKNTARDALRSRRLLADPEEAGEPASAFDVDSEVAYHDLISAIRALPDNDREVLERRYVLGWGNADIARQLGLTENAVAARLFRARARLQKMLGEGGDVHAAE